MKPPADDIDLVWARHTGIRADFTWLGARSVAYFQPAPEPDPTAHFVLWVSVPKMKALYHQPRASLRLVEENQPLQHPVRPGWSPKFGRMLGAAQRPDEALAMPFARLVAGRNEAKEITITTFAPFDLGRFWRQNEFDQLPVLSTVSDTMEVWEYIGERSRPALPLAALLQTKPEALAVRDQLIAYRAANKPV